MHSVTDPAGIPACSNWPAFRRDWTAQRAPFGTRCSRGTLRTRAVGREHIVATPVAVCPRESPAEVSAGEVSAKLLLDVARQPAFVVLARVGKEVFEIPADKIIQDGFLGTPRDIGRRERGHEGLRAWRPRARTGSSETADLGSASRVADRAALSPGQRLPGGCVAARGHGRGCRRRCRFAAGAASSARAGGRDSRTGASARFRRIVRSATLTTP